MKKIEVNNINYELVKDDKKVFDENEFIEKYTDYFEEFDYVFGDYAYDKLRLKGFYDSDNKKVKDINNIDNLEEYIKEYCAYGAKCFLLKKIRK